MKKSADHLVSFVKRRKSTVFHGLWLAAVTEARHGKALVVQDNGVFAS